MTNSIYNSKEETTNQVNKWRVSFPSLDITAIIADTDIEVRQFGKLLILFHAVWSGPSIINLSRILDQVYRFQPLSKIFVVDIDSVSLDYVKRILGHLSHGHGEALYFVNGELKAKCRDQLSQEEFNKFVQQFKNI